MPKQPNDCKGFALTTSPAERIERKPERKRRAPFRPPAQYGLRKRIPVFGLSSEAVFNPQ